jgi:hypothetical protein
MRGDPRSRDLGNRQGAENTMPHNARGSRHARDETLDRRSPAKAWFGVALAVAVLALGTFALLKFTL